jgi:hypothetical protein
MLVCTSFIHFFHTPKKEFTGIQLYTCGPQKVCTQLHRTGFPKISENSKNNVWRNKGRLFCPAMVYSISAVVQLRGYSRRLRNWNMYHCIWASSPWRYSPVNIFFRHTVVLRWSDLNYIVLVCLDSFLEEYLYAALFSSVQFSWIFWSMVCKWSPCAGS